MRRTIILISGPPAAGKTTLARPVARELGLPLLQKDDIKEALFDTLGTGDARWSRRLSDAAFAVMFRMARGHPRVVLEGNLRPEHADVIRQLDPEPLEIYCFCEHEELLHRSHRRKERHGGHHDLSDHDLIRRARVGPLEIGTRVLRLNTADPDATDQARAWLRRELSL